MQQGTNSSAAPPAPPPGVIRTAPGSDVYTVMIPATPQELMALKERRSELSNQLTSAAGRRNEIAKRLRGADGADRAGLEQRIAVLDQRMLQLESDIAVTGQALTSAPASLIASTGGPLSIADISQFDKLPILFILFVLAPIAIGFAVRSLKRPKREPASPALQESSARLERLENSVDAIAVEIERISEGQRFVTRLLSDPGQAALLSAARQPERARIGSE